MLRRFARPLPSGLLFSHGLRLRARVGALERGGRRTTSQREKILAAPPGYFPQSPGNQEAASIMHGQNPAEAVSGQANTSSRYLGNPSIEKRRLQLELDEHLDWVTDAVSEAWSAHAINGEENDLMCALLKVARKLGLRRWIIPDQRYLSRLT